MRQNGRGVGRNQSAHHQADKADGQKLEHRRVRGVVSDEARVKVGKRRLNVRQLGVNDQRAKAHQNPRPWTQHIVGNVEKQHGAQGVPFRFRCQHALGDVAAAARFCPGVPDRPPLDGDRHDEDRHRQIPVIGEIRQDVQVVQPARPFECGQLLHQAAQARPPPAVGGRNTPRQSPPSS